MGHKSRILPFLDVCDGGGVALVADRFFSLDFIIEEAAVLVEVLTVFAKAELAIITTQLKSEESQEDGPYYHEVTVIVI